MIRRLFNYYRKTFWSPEKYARHVGVTIGTGCLISTKKFSSEAYLISIGDYCRIAKDVSFYTHGGLWAQRKKHEKLDYFGKIEIGNYTYIGADSKIMAGVRIGDDVIVGAGSVVTKTVEAGLIVAGNPARIIGETKTFVDKIQKISLPTYGMDFMEKKNFLLSLADSKFIQK
ncbi:MAG: acyltransferase [Bacteroidota bacterium]